MKRPKSRVIVAHRGSLVWGTLLALVVCLGWGFSLSARAQSAWDKRAETDIDLPASFPPFSPQAKLQAFWVSATSPYEFAIDTTSITPVSAEAVRATLVITSTQGVRNVSVIGFRCNLNQRRTIATARADGSWNPTPSLTWKELSAGGLINQAERVLASTLCLGSAANSDPRDALRRLAATFTESKH